MTMQAVPKYQDLLSQFPAGREYHAQVTYEPIKLENEILVQMRAPPEYSVAAAYQDDEDSMSDYENEEQEPVGAYPGTSADY